MDESLKRKRPPKKTISFWQLLVFAVIIFIATMALMTLVFSKDTVDGPSMEPNLSTGDRLLSVQHKKVHRNDLVVIYAPDKASSAYLKQNSKTASDIMFVGDGKLFNGDYLVPLKSRELYIKRVIGLPGDTVESKNDQLYVNGKRVKQSYLKQSFTKAALKRHNLSEGRNDANFTQDFSLKDLASTHATRVPAGHYFVLGDNRIVSHDSRDFGFVPAENIQSVVVMRYWPLTSLKFY